MEAYNNKANSLMKLKRYEEALCELDRALSIDKNYSSALFNKGKVFYFMKNFLEGDIFLDKALSLNSKLLVAVEQLKHLKSLNK